MGRIMIINGSPRAPKSNSKRYAEIFAENCNKEVVYRNITRNNHIGLCNEIKHFNDLLFVFPLYADALPVAMLNFLKSLEANPPEHKPTISILINCGFLEHEQNEVAVSMMRLFCKRNGYAVGSVLMLGSGEAILKTPFRYIANRSIKKLARSIENGKYKTIKATMPLTKKLFVMAADIYWKRFGKKFGTSKNEMQTMKIEGC